MSGLLPFGSSEAGAADSGGDARGWPWAALMLSGLSFWFLLGFPFGHHNESWVWAHEFGRDGYGLRDALTVGVSPVLGFRPLATALAWATYRVSGGGIALGQLVNWLLACVAWLIVLRAAPRQRTVWIALLVTGGFFSGYLFLFHLHGVFYGPLLILTALLSVAAARPARSSVRVQGALAAAALVGALFHPFALPLLIAAAVGQCVEAPRPVGARRLAVTAIVALAGFGFAVLLVPPSEQALVGSARNWSAWLTTWRMAELHPALSLLAAALGALTWRSLFPRLPLPSLALPLGAAAGLWSLGLPVLLLWFALCLARAALARRWSLALLVGASVLLPLASQTGSPTYSVFALLVCSVVAGLAPTEGLRPLPSWGALVVVGLGLSALVAMRLGARLPVISSLAHPLLAESEKTRQLEQIVRWNQANAGARLVLVGDAASPVESTTSVARDHRPPTQQHWLDAALRPPPGSASLRVSFGDEQLPGQVLHSIDGRHARWARVQREPSQD